MKKEKVTLKSAHNKRVGNHPASKIIEMFYLTSILKIIISVIIIFILFSCVEKKQEQTVRIQSDQIIEEWFSEYNELAIEKTENMIKNPFKNIKFYITTEDGNQIRERLPEKYRRKSIYAGVNLNYNKIEALIDSVNVNSPEVREIIVRIHNSTIRLPISKHIKYSNNTNRINIGEVSEVPSKVNVLLSFFNSMGDELIVFSGKFNSKGKKDLDNENIDVKLNGFINISDGMILKIEDNSNSQNDNRIAVHYEIYRVSRHRKKTELFTSGYAELHSNKYENYIPIHLTKSFFHNDLVIVAIDSVFIDGNSRIDINLSNNIYAWKLSHLDIDIAGDYSIEPASLDLTKNSAYTNDRLSFFINYTGKMFHEFSEEDVMVVNLDTYRRHLIILDEPIGKFFAFNIIPGKYLMIINPNRQKPERTTKNNYHILTIPE